MSRYRQDEAERLTKQLRRSEHRAKRNYDDVVSEGQHKPTVHGDTIDGSGNGLRAIKSLDQAGVTMGWISLVRIVGSRDPKVRTGAKAPPFSSQPTDVLRRIVGEIVESEV